MPLVDAYYVLYKLDIGTISLFHGYPLLSLSPSLLLEFHLMMMQEPDRPTIW